MSKQQLSLRKKMHLNSAAAFGFLLSLSGCSGITGLSGAASMRIDVDVYQGPLSMEPEMQWGALYGQVTDGIQRLDGVVLSSACVDKKRVGFFRPGICPTDIQEKRKLDLLEKKKIAANASPVEKPHADTAVSDAEEALEEIRVSSRTPREFANYLCGNMAWRADIRENKLKGLVNDLCSVRRELVSVFNWMSEWDFAYQQLLLNAGGQSSEALGPYQLKTTLYQKDAVLSDGSVGYSTEEITAVQVKAALINTLANVSSVAEQMRVQAVYYASSHVGNAANKRKVRTAIVDYAVFMAEYSNTLKSRADALLKQTRGTDRRELPLSVQLREANPTAFLNLYVWNVAYDGRVAGEPSGTAYFQDRVKVINRLYNDEAWTRVNTAYASGQGDVSMAFIKDDIGNWNLKSFDNDPTALLQAYKEVGKAALGTALTIASGGKVGSFRQADKALDNLSRAQTALALAENVAYGGGSSSVAPVENRTLKRLHGSTLSRLTNLVKEYKVAAEKLEKDIKDNKALLKTAEDSLERAQRKVRTKEDNPPKDTKGETVETLRVKSVSATNRTAQTDEDTTKSHAKIAENNAAIAATIPDRNRLVAALREEEAKGADRSEATISNINKNLAKLDADTGLLRQEIENFNRIITERAQTKGELEGKSNTFLTNAGLLETHNAEVAKLKKDTLEPTEKVVNDLNKKLEQMAALKDGGLYKKALEKAAYLINSHERFVSELEALVVEDQSASIPATAPVTLPPSPVQPPAS